MLVSGLSADHHDEYFSIIMSVILQDFIAFYLINVTLLLGCSSPLTTLQTMAETQYGQINR